MRVGVLGLGSMGRAVAVNLVRAGIQTTVWNRSPQPFAELVAAGAIGARDVAELFGCDVVLSVLLDDAAIRAVILDSGAVAAAPAGTVHVCMSSVSTSLARDLTRTHAQNGSQFAAASMFGRPEAAASAKLEIVTAGPPEILEQVEVILRSLGRTWRMGDEPQLACLTKIAGNFMIGSAVQAMAESAALVSAGGGDPAAFFVMMGETLFPAPIYRSYGAAIAKSQPPGVAIGPKFALEGIERTLGEAKAAGIKLRLAELMKERLEQAESQGLDSDDWSIALAKVARQ